MNESRPSHPLTLGLFEKRIEGDDCLLELAQLRFQEAGMGAEMHAGTPEQLERVLKFRPAPDAPVVVHLPRDFNLADENCRRRIADFAGRFAGRQRDARFAERTREDRDAGKHEVSRWHKWRYAMRACHALTDGLWSSIVRRCTCRPL